MSKRVTTLAQRGAAAIALAALITPALFCAGAQAQTEAGHPEVYDNWGLIGSREHAVPVTGYGEIHLESKDLGSEGIECEMDGFGVAFNEGSPLRAQGQILSWGAGGHVPNALHPQLGAKCRP